MYESMHNTSTAAGATPPSPATGTVLYYTILYYTILHYTTL